MKINKQNLLGAMDKANLTNQKLAEKAEMSITQVSNIRSGKGTTYETVSKLAKALSVSIDDLIESEG